MAEEIKPEEAQSDVPAAQMEPMQIRANVEDGNRIASKPSLTGKTDTPLIETPFSVQVVPAQIFEEQRINRLQEALENVSGVRSNNNDVEGYIYKVRGFDVKNLFRNNLALSFSLPTIQETANLQRVEVLKGPASILFGRVDPGGVINLVTKKPESEPYYKISQDLGMYDFYRTIFDASGPINDSKTVSYRLSGAVQDYDAYRDFQGGRRQFIAPVVNFKLSDQTELTIDTQYMKNKAQSDIGIPAVGKRPASIPLKRSFQESNDPLDKTESYNLGYELKHHFNDDWAITNRFLYSHANLWKMNVVGSSLDETTGILDRTTQGQTLVGDVYSTNLDLTGKFEALGAKHNVVVGLDYLHDYYDYRYTEGGGNFPINIYNPIYGTVSKADYQDAANGVGFAGGSSYLVKQTGLYIQDQITWFDKLHFTFGGRYDDAEQYLGRGATKAAAKAARRTNPKKEDKEFSPRAGLLYEITPSFSAYTSYSKSFGTNNGFDTSGKMFDPEQAKQHEVGLKAEIAEQLFANVAIYHLTKTNVLTADTSTPDPNDSVARGEVRSRGVELDVLGKITDRLSMNAAYAYTDTEITKDENGSQGLQLDNVPRHTARTFLTYDFGSGGLGWRVGAGLYGAGKAYVNPDNTAKIPGFVRLDANAAYSGKWNDKKWTAQLNIRNLLNKDYFDGSDIFYNFIADPRLYLLPGAPLNAVATFGLEF
jgi:iron complex outermembrane recepter protein